MGLFSDLFLSRDGKSVYEVHNEICHYWKNTNDYLLAHQRYLQDLNTKFKLEFNDEFIATIPTVILSWGAMHNISRQNTIYIFSQFIYFFVFGWQKPNRNRHSDSYIYTSLEYFDDYVINNQSRIDTELPFILNKSAAKKL